MSHRVLCVYWGFHSWWCSRQRGGLHGLLNLAISPDRMPLTISPERMPLTHGCHRPPPDMPDPGIDPTTFWLRDLRLVRDLRLARLSWLGILVCVCARARACVYTRAHVCVGGEFY